MRQFSYPPLAALRHKCFDCALTPHGEGAVKEFDTQTLDNITVQPETEKSRAPTCLTRIKDVPEGPSAERPAG